ncbi:MAG TPA: hypothetical protein VFQ39_08495, partial [Longimicrobium sp.]|nr:hypothetical protein [Longimicrobium sp.]
MSVEVEYCILDAIEHYCAISFASRGERLSHLWHPGRGMTASDDERWMRLALEEARAAEALG